MPAYLKIERSLGLQGRSSAPAVRTDVRMHVSHYLLTGKNPALHDQKTVFLNPPRCSAANSWDAASGPFRRLPGNWRKSRRALSADKYVDQLKPKLTLTASEIQ